jgi:glycosyltransferase involved in cell wall biosynthesis
MTTEALIITIGPWHEKPWWWQHIEKHTGKCNVEYVRITTEKNKQESNLSSKDFLIITLNILKTLRKYKPKYVFTFECGVASFLLAFLQTLGFKNEIRHVILQFIMREKENNLKSRAKFLLMRLILSSIYAAACSSTVEVAYYRKAFKWAHDKTFFLPINSEPEYFDINVACCEDYILTAGRTFRDYKTLLNAVSGSNYTVVVVASKWNINEKDLPPNVLIKYDIDKKKLTELMIKCKFVVVPLEEKSISTGQSVLMQAMAMGKAVVITKSAGSVDYIKNLESGILVPPNDSEKLRKAIKYLYENDNARIRIGENAKKEAYRYIPVKYLKNLKNLLCFK